MTFSRPAWSAVAVLVVIARGASAQPRITSRKVTTSAVPKLAAAGLTLEQALGHPDATILVGVDGKETTVGDLRRLVQKREQGLSALKLHPALTGGKSSAPRPGAAARARASLDLAKQEIAAANQARATHQRTLNASLGKKVSAIGQPAIWKVNGKTASFHVTPGGIVAIEGTGFGDGMGQVNVFGKFPTGAAALRVVDWRDDLVTAVFPDGIRGVPDLDIRFDLITRTGKILSMPGGLFVATREEITVTDGVERLVKFQSSPSWPAGFRAEVQRYYSAESTTCAQPGVDTLTVPDPGHGFVVTGIGAEWGRTDSGDGDLSGSPGNRMFFPGYSLGQWNGDTISVHWGVWRNHSSPVGMLQARDTCASDYMISLSLVGPAGVSPF